ncbi:MAG: hypothetical protein AAFX39_09970 [Pseudomonadota bacterium]
MTSKYIACLAAGAASIWLIGAGIPHTQAGEIADLAAEAEELIGRGNGAEALERLREAMILVAGEMPLSVREATFVTNDPPGFGVYDPRQDAVFAADEPLVAYVEPVGVTWIDAGEGYLSSALTVDFELLSETGQVLAQQDGFGNFSFTSREHNLEVMTHLTLEVSGAPAGAYVLRYIYTDTNSGEMASIDLPFEIAEGVAAE